MTLIIEIALGIILAGVIVCVGIPLAILIPCWALFLVTAPFRWIARLRERKATVTS